jgi:histidine triad (HIT) family protein
MSLDGKYDDDNIFAKILRGDIPCVKVYEDKHTLAFMDVFPQSKGHTLVISKNEQARNLIDVSTEGLANIMATVQKLTGAIKTALVPGGIVVTQFNGAPAGQTVFHLHVHIIPRYTIGDLRPHASGEMADMDELNALADKIKAVL